MTNRTIDSKKIWLASPYMHEEERRYVKDAFDKNWITTAGENINELEKMACEYTGVKYAVALSSGTSALHLAMIDAGVKAGDKIFSSDMTFAATCNPIMYQGATPVFIDEEMDTWNMDPAKLEEGFRKFPDVKIVVAANLYGIPAKLAEIQDVCDRHGALLIEDAAESLGAACCGAGEGTDSGRQTGSFGHWGVISFNGNKIITGSTGGMLLTDDKDAADHVRKLSTQAREPFSWYQHEEVGYNYRMSNIVAGVARGQFEHLDEHVTMKKAIYERYEEGLAGLPLQMHGGGNYWLSCALIDCNADEGSTLADDVTPAEIIKALAEYNIEARHIWKPMTMQPVYANCPAIGGDVGRDIFQRGLCLPSDLNMSPAEQEEVIEIIRGCFE